MEEHKELSRFECVQKKIKEGTDFDRWIAYWHFQNDRIVFTNGLFDQMTPREVEHLYQAAQQGSVLIVGIPSDTHPLAAKVTHKQDFRALVVAAVGCVDAVVVYDDERPDALIAKIKPSTVAEECK